MPFVLVRHRVKHFAKWKPVYDAHGATRQAGGSKGARLFRNIDKPKETVILLEWSDIDTARAFVKSKDLREAMKRAGVVDKPDICFLDEVEQAPA
jgi:heme-degrading monooxygenase HmoA